MTTIDPQPIDKPHEWDLPHAWVYTYGDSMTAIPKSGAVTPPPPPPQSFPQLVNPDFELGLSAWTPYRMDGPIGELVYELRDREAPGMDALAIHYDPAAGYNGKRAVMLSGFNRCWRGGVYQTLVNVPIGAHVRIGAWMMTYGNEYPGCRNVNINMNSLIGIGFDPLGLTDPNAGRVDWKMIAGGDTTPVGSLYDPRWQYVEHSTVTTTGALTVFLSGDLGGLSLGRANWPLNFTRWHVDDVILEVIA